MPSCAIPAAPSSKPPRLRDEWNDAAAFDTIAEGVVGHRRAEDCGPHGEHCDQHGLSLFAGNGAARIDEPTNLLFVQLRPFGAASDRTHRMGDQRAEDELVALLGIAA